MSVCVCVHARKGINNKDMKREHSARVIIIQWNNHNYLPYHQPLDKDPGTQMLL